MRRRRYACIYCGRPATGTGSFGDLCADCARDIAADRAAAQSDDIANERADAAADAYERDLYRGDDR